MTDRELKKLSRTDLMEILLELTTENEQLRKELDETKDKLNNKMLAIDNAGSLAEAALQLNGVFEATQEACNQYTINVQEIFSRQKEICEQMERETEEKCTYMVRKAKEEADGYWNYARERVKSLYLEQSLPEHLSE